MIENRIQEAMATGAFDDLPGRGKPLPIAENPFEAMSGDALAHRILKNAGCAPGWVELGKEIRQEVLNARANLALGWARCAPEWPPRDGSPLHAMLLSGELHATQQVDSSPLRVANGVAPHEAAPDIVSGGEAEADSPPPPPGAAGGWRIYRQPSVLGDAAPTSGTESTDAAESLAVAASDAAAGSEAAAADSREDEEASALVSALAVRLAAEHGPCPAEWREVLDTFQAEVRAVNKLVDSYNLSVPASWMSVHRLNLPNEEARALIEAPQRAKELHAARSGGLARGTDGGGGGSGGFGASATFALHEGATFPSVFEAVRAVLFAR